MSSALTRIVATFFYTGYLPLIPGTFGTAAGLGVFLLLRPGWGAQLLLLAVFTALGFIFSGKAEKLFSVKDPKYVVIDEVAGIFLTFLFVPWDLRVILIGFILFRVLDTVKPYPADKLQDLPGSAGIMLDDLVAAAYANIILQIVTRFLLHLHY